MRTNPILSNLISDIDESGNMVIYIRRAEGNDARTTGVLYTGGFCCYTLELPWIGNKKNVSCIPTGQYVANVDRSVTIGGEPVIRLEDVPGRTGILVHVANYTREIQGCVAVGMGKDKNSVISSRKAMSDLLGIIGDKPIVVDIDWA